MLCSLEHKFHGENLIWWNSLSMKAKYSFLFKWRSYLSHDSSDKSISSKFKHWLKSSKPNYKPAKANARNAKIDHIIDEPNS